MRRLSLPLMWGFFAMTAFNIADTVFIARLGTTTLAAYGFTLPLVMFFMGIIFGLSVGTGSVIARAYGRDPALAHRLSTDSLTLTAIIVAAAALVGHFLAEPIFRLMGAGEDVMPLIMDYMTVWYGGMAFLAVMMVGNTCIRATGDTVYPAIIMTVTAVVNVTLDPFLIYGWGPFPALGMTGAAVAVVTTYFFSCIVSVYLLAKHRQALAFPLFSSETLHSWKKILHVGIPSIINNQIAPLSAATITFLAAGIGHEAVAALGVASRVEGLTVVIFYALGAGAAIFAGQNYGAGNFGRVSEIVTVAARAALLWGAVLAAVLWAFSGIIPPFFDPNPQVVGFTQQYLRIVPISYGAMGVLIVSNAVLNAMGKPVSATMLMMTRALILYVPLAWIAEHYYGFAGILWALVFSNFVVSAASYLWNKKVAS